MAFALHVVSCGGKEEPPPQTGFQQGQPGQQPYGQQAQSQQQPYGAQQPMGQAPPSQQRASQPAPGQVPPLGAVMSDPTALEKIIAGALSAGAASLGAVTGGDLAPIEYGIKGQAQQSAKGMKPEGQLMSARVQPGGHAEGSLTMQPGACYTVVGFAGLGVFEYQLNLITAAPMPPQVIAQSPAGGVAPVIGPNEQCVRNPYPLPMTVKVDMHVLRGQGLVGAQVYKK